MGDRYAGMQDVEFDFEAAETLASVAKSSAGSVRDLQGERSNRAVTAQAEFRGYFARLFADNVATGTTDANNLATCLDKLAKYTSELIRAAEEENVRRQHARDWADRQKAREENVLVDIYYNLAFWESKDPQPNITNDAPSYSAGDISLARQELPTRGGGGGGGTSSADPNALRIFGLPSAWYSWFESNGPSKLRNAWDAFVAGCKWGTLDASSTVTALDQWVSENKEERDWANAVAAAFEAAGTNGGTTSVSDASLLEALAQAGLDPVRGAISLTPPELQGINPTTGYSNDPVNTVTGNFIEPETDISFAGASATLQLTRMYNSQSDRVGLFGRGWASVLETRVTRTDEGAVFSMADGREIRFASLSDEPARAESDNFWIKTCETGTAPGVQLPTGTAILVRNNAGSWWAFTADGEWVAEGSGPGTGVSVRRNSDGKIVALEHERGRAITIEYSDDRVVSATASDGRRVEYIYDVLGRLCETSDAIGARSYRYNEAGLISAVVGASGVVEAENTYDDEGRVVLQVTEFGREVRFAYLPGRVTSVSDTDGTNSNTWVADRRGRLTGIIDGNGERITMAYDQHGNRTSVIDRDGSRTESSYDERGRLTNTRLPSEGETSTSYDEFDRVATVMTSSGGVIEYGYASDYDRHPSRVIDAFGGETTMVWHDGLLTEVVDPTGVRIVMSYDQFGELVATTNAAGNVAQLQRDAAGRISAAISPFGNRTEYRYDQRSGMLVERVEADGGRWRFEYGVGGKVTAAIDPLEGRTVFEYGAHGQLVRTVDPLGRETSREFDVMGNVSSLHLPGGTEWVYEHDALSRVRGVTDPAGSTWHVDYDELGQPRESVSPAGVRSQLSRSQLNHSVTAKEAGRETTIVFDEFERPRATTTDDGSEQVIAYDRGGRPVEIVDAEGGLTVITYELGGRIASVTSPAGRITRYTYDACGRLASSIDAAGAETRYEYNADSLVSAIVGPTGEVSRFEYDACGRIARREVPGEGVSRTSYDLMGRIVFTQDSRLGQRRFSYDAGGQMVTATNGLGGVTRFEHDELGRITSITDPLGGVTRRGYDRLGRVTSNTDPLGRTTTASYDADGRQLTQTDAEGRVTEWQYNEQGSLAATLIDGVEMARVERDNRNRVQTVRDTTGNGRAVSHTLRYDRLGRLIERARDEQAMRWEYDADGLRRAQVDPSGTRVEYDYDAAGRLLRTRHPQLGEASYEYDAFGRLVSARTGDTQQLWQYERGYVAKHTRMDASGVHSTDIARDDSGRVVRVSNGGTSVTYGYDDACQLVSASTASSTHRWSYDPAGRLIEETQDGATRAYRYDAAGQLLSERSSDGRLNEYSYDALGRRTSEKCGEDRAILSWDARGWLSMVTTVTTAGKQSFSLWVDAMGELAQIGEADVWWDSSAAHPSPTLVGGFATLAGPGATGIARAQDAVPTSAESTQSGESDWAASGWRTSRSNSLTDPWRAGDSASMLTGEVSITAAGGLVIAGLEWMGARVYDSAARGFLSVDPLDPVVGAGWAGNPYSFAGNDPMHALDPLGLRPVTDAELRAYADSRQGALASAASAVGEWWNENWEYVAAGAMIVGGVALMCTGIGGPAGIALMAGSGALLAGGISTVSQKAQTGSVDWGKVGVDALVGGAMGAAGGGAAMLAKTAASGAASAGAAWTIRIGVNGSVGGVGGGVGYLADNNWQIKNGWDFAGSIAGGTVSGGTGAFAGPAGGTLANKIGMSASGRGAQAISAGFDGVGTFAGSVTEDVVSGRDVNLGSAGVRGLVGTGASFVSGEIVRFTGTGQHGVDTLAQVPHFSPRSVASALDLSKVNSRDLWADAIIGEAVGFGAERLVGVN